MSEPTAAQSEPEAGEGGTSVAEDRDQAADQRDQAGDERDISYRHVTASEIADHWSHTVSTRRADRRPPTQTKLDLGDA